MNQSFFECDVAIVLSILAIEAIHERRVDVGHDRAGCGRTQASSRQKV